MSQAKIIENKGDGLYVVELVFDTARLDGYKKHYEAKIARLDTLISSKTIELSGTTDLDERLEIQSEISALKLQKAAASKELEYLEASVPPERVRLLAWCADYSTELPLGKVVGLADIAGERARLNVRPGWDEQADYQKDRDGIIQPAVSGSTPSVFINLCVYPGWQKWLPRYRYGRIMALDKASDIADISLEPEFSREQSLDVNYLSTLSSVPVRYMYCNSKPFSVGDDVLVEFPNLQWGGPQVIGFKDHPKPCGIDYIQITINGEIPPADWRGTVYNLRAHNPLTHSTSREVVSFEDRIGLFDVSDLDIPIIDAPHFIYLDRYHYPDAVMSGKWVFLNGFLDFSDNLAGAEDNPPADFFENAQDGDVFIIRLLLNADYTTFNPPTIETLGARFRVIHTFDGNKVAHINGYPISPSFTREFVRAATGWIPMGEQEQIAPALASTSTDCNEMICENPDTGVTERGERCGDISAVFSYSSPYIYTAFQFSNSHPVRRAVIGLSWFRSALSVGHSTIVENEDGTYTAVIDFSSYFIGYNGTVWTRPDATDNMSQESVSGSGNLALGYVAYNFSPIPIFINDYRHMRWIEANSLKNSVQKFVMVCDRDGLNMAFGGGEISAKRLVCYDGLNDYPLASYSYYLDQKAAWEIA